MSLFFWNNQKVFVTKFLSLSYRIFILLVSNAMAKSYTSNKNFFRHIINCNTRSILLQLNRQWFSGAPKYQKQPEVYKLLFATFDMVRLVELFRIA